MDDQNKFGKDAEQSPTLRAISEVDSATDSSLEMMAISTNQLMVGSTSPTDIFLKMPSGKLLLIIKAGAKLNLSELHATASNQVQQLYVKKDEFNKLLGLNLQIAGMAVSRSELSESQKIKVLASTADGVFREIETLGFNQLSCTHAKFVTKSLITLVESKNDLRNLINSMQAINEELVQHSMAVSAISVMIAEVMGWSAPQRLEKIALGGFLHDIGLREIPEELIFKPRHEMSLEEVKTYEEHVTRGAEILRSMPEMPDDIVSIALQHHENSVGTGYPFRVKDVRINPLAKVVGLADAYTDLIFTSKGNPTARSAEEALKFIETSLGQPFNRQIFEALKSCVAGTQTKVGKVKVLG